MKTWLPDIWPQRSPGSSYFLHHRSVAQYLPLMSRNLCTCNDTTCVLKRYGVGILFHQICTTFCHILSVASIFSLDDMMWPQPRQHGETTTLSLIEIFDLTRYNTHIYTDTHSGTRPTTSHKKVTRKQNGHPGATLGWFRVLACEPFKSLVLDVTGGKGSYVAKMVSSNLQTKAPGVRESQPDSFSLGLCEGRWVLGRRGWIFVGSTEINDMRAEVL